MLQFTISDRGYIINPTREDYGWSPQYAKWISTILSKDRPVYDFGCGCGDYSNVLSNEGFDCIGYEGAPMPPDKRAFANIQQVDIAMKLDWLNELPKGHVICLEVMEHIPAQYEHVTLDNIARICNGRLALSWAIEGTIYPGHVNCKNNPQAMSSVMSHGFKFNRELTIKGRQLGDYGGQGAFLTSSLVFDRI
jgi:hypothetical protein